MLTKGTKIVFSFLLVMFISACSCQPNGLLTKNTPVIKKEVTLRACTIRPDFSRKARVSSPIESTPISPNRTKLIGKVNCSISVSSKDIGYEPALRIFVAEVAVMSAENVEGLPNKLNGKEGEFVQVYSKLEFTRFDIGKTLTAAVEWRGDNQNGNYWIIDSALDLK
jgi:hypothetical protein